MTTDDEIARLEATMARLDALPAREVDSAFYEEVLRRLVALGRERDDEPQQPEQTTPAQPEK